MSWHLRHEIVQSLFLFSGTLLHIHDRLEAWEYCSLYFDATFCLRLSFSWICIVLTDLSRQFNILSYNQIMSKTKHDVIYQHINCGTVVFRDERVCVHTRIKTHSFKYALIQMITERELSTWFCVYVRMYVCWLVWGCVIEN